MIALPQIQLAGQQLALPLSEDSARQIAAILLQPQSADTHALWVELLAVDPPLLLWVSLHWSRLAEEAPTSIAELAQWLAPHALQLLDWSPDAASTEELASSESSRWREVVQHTLMTLPGYEEASDPHSLQAILTSHLQALAQSDFAIAPEHLPPFLQQWLAAALPLETASGELSPDIKRDLRRWRTKTTGSGGMLPRLTERLRRLEAFETDFEHTLLSEKLSAMRELAYGASHEINNPLANISTRAQTLLQEEHDPERRRKLATIHLQAMRAHEMIANLMHFAKPPKLVMEPVDLGQCLATVVAELAEWAAAQGTEMIVAAPAMACLVQGDRQQLMIALRALLRNSLEALAAGGRIEAEIEIAEQAIVRIIDNGPGVLPEAREHLFDPFYSGREAGRGLGFGLAWSWRVVERHGGRIEFDSQPGHGTEFRIKLPLAEQAVPRVDVR